MTIPVELGKALEKAIGEYKVTEPGTYQIKENLQVSIDAVVTKFKDEEYTPTVKIPLKASLAIALQKAGAQRENISNLLIESMKEAISLDESAVKVMDKIVDEFMDRVSALTGALPKCTRQGKTTVKVNEFKITVDKTESSDIVKELEETLDITKE